MDKAQNQKTTYMIIGMLLAIGIPLILIFSEPQDNSIARYGYWHKLIEWLWLLVIYLYAIKIEKQKFLLWAETKRGAVFYIISVIIVMGLMFVAGAFQVLLDKLGLKMHNSALMEQVAAYMHTHFLLLLVTCATAGVVEELIFRGYLIPRLNLVLKSNWLAVIISSLVFGLSHYSYGTLQNIIVPFLIGLIFGAYYLKYKNIKVLMVCHFVFDFLGLMAMGNHTH